MGYFPDDSYTSLGEIPGIGQHLTRSEGGHMIVKIASFFNSGTNALLSAACILAWVIVGCGVYAAFNHISDRAAIILLECPPPPVCAQGSK